MQDTEAPEPSTTFTLGWVERSGGGTPGGLDQRRDRRGQTTIDFAVGMSIFLLALTFVLVFVPGMLEPFTAGTQEETPAVDRVADELTQQRLGDPARPYVLNETCTRAFFDDGTPPSGCQFDDGSLQDRVGVKSWTRVNVTVRGDLTDSGSDRALCWDGGDDDLAEIGSGDCGDGDDVELRRGSKPSGSGGETVSARRVVGLAGEDVTIEVVMW